MNDTRSSSSGDRQIIENLQKNGLQKRKGEEELFSTYQYFIQQGMRKHSLSEQESFDAYSDAVLAAIEKITSGSFEGLSSLKTWLYQIFHNKCVDLFRKKTTNKNSVHQTISISGLFHLTDNAQSIIQKLVDQTDFAILRQKLDNLGDACRQLLLLSADGNSDRQIATMMEYKTAEVVKTSRLRCLDRLRRLYKSE
ncbi:MAG: RNA polymerase sigma factor [Chitinophagaceae bacterium]